MNCISLHDVSMTYDTTRGPLSALENVSLEVREGEFLSILGQTGCGKSTLLKLISGIFQPSAGTILVQGKTVTEACRARSFGFVFQDPVLLPWRSAIKNVLLPMEISDYPVKERERRCRHLLDVVGLGEFAEHHPWELSGGMRQRVSIARALAFDPPILLMDEPFSALDENTRVSLHGDLLRLWSEGRKTVVFVTHSIAEAAYLSDRVVVMAARPGRVENVVEIDLPRPRTPELLDDPAYLGYVRQLRTLLDSSARGEQ